MIDKNIKTNKFEEEFSEFLHFENGGYIFDKNSF